MAEFILFPCDQKLTCAKAENKTCGRECFLTSNINHRADGITLDNNTGRIVPYFINEEAEK